MLTSEEQAKTKTCPHLPVDREVDGFPTNSVVRERVVSFATCLGSNCMNWRWYDGSGVVDCRRRGFCGLAGIPNKEAE